MVGNDVIDIAYTKQMSDWTRKGFLPKAFNQDEQQLIRLSTQPFDLVWRMWSMKESAYKLYMQCTPGHLAFYAPCHFHCHLISHTRGYVIYRDVTFDTCTTKNSGCIFSYASLTNLEHVKNKLFQFAVDANANKSKALKRRLITYVAKSYELESKDIEIIKTDRGIPKLTHQGSVLNLNISLTHHGIFGAFSLSE